MSLVRGRGSETGRLKSVIIVVATAFVWVLLYSNLEWFAALLLQVAGIRADFKPCAAVNILPIMASEEVG